MINVSHNADNWWSGSHICLVLFLLTEKFFDHINLFLFLCNEVVFKCNVSCLIKWKVRVYIVHLTCHKHLLDQLCHWHLDLTCKLADSQYLWQLDCLDHWFYRLLLLWCWLMILVVIIVPVIIVVKPIVIIVVISCVTVVAYRVPEICTTALLLDSILVIAICRLVVIILALIISIIILLIVIISALIVSVIVIIFTLIVVAVLVVIIVIVLLILVILITGIGIVVWLWLHLLVLLLWCFLFFFFLLWPCLLRLFFLCLNRLVSAQRLPHKFHHCIINAALCF